MIPVHYLLIGFKDPEISPKLKNRVLALQALHDAGAITVINLVVVKKDDDGTVTAVQYSDLTPEQRDALGVAAGALVGYGAAGIEGAQAAAEVVADRKLSGASAMTRAELAAEFVDAMPNGTSALLLVVAHNWVDKFGEGVAESGGVILRSGFILPEDLVMLGEVLGQMSEE